MDFLLAQHGLHYILDAWIFACHIQISTFEADLGSFSSLLSHEVQDEWIHLICLHLFAFLLLRRLHLCGYLKYFTAVGVSTNE